jgi:beta-galactosidase
VLAVRVDNSWDYREKATNSTYQWSDKNFNANYGGIPKNVRLHLTPRLYQTLPLYTNLGATGVYVYATDFDQQRRSATINAESQVKNETGAPQTFAYRVILEDLNGKTVKTFDGGSYTLAPGATTTARASAKVNNLNFWSWGYGYLYRVRTIVRPLITHHSSFIIQNDEVVTHTGFRQTEFANGLFKLNGRVLQLKGYAQRTSNEWPAVGLSVPAWLSDYSNGLMVESNANLVRWMHITPWKQDVEACDRVGLLQAMPAGDSEKDVDGRRWEHRVEAMRDAIIYNRNNPSVIFYESGNKSVSEAHQTQMRALRDQYDPHGGRASGSREMLDSRVAEYGGEMLYINKSAAKPLWAMEYSRDEGLRKYWDEFSPPFHKDGDGPLHNGQDASVYNRNQDSHAIENIVRWHDYWEARPGTGKRVSAGGVNIVFSDTNTHHRGAENYRRSGEVDAMRLPKDGFYAHQVMWDGWVDTEQPRARILGHWNYANDTRKNIYVVSSAARVELFLNGKSLGYGTNSSRFLFTFKDITWQAGALRAVGYDERGKKICDDEKRTTGPPVALKMTARTGPQGLRADGADLALVEFEVVDKGGNRCPTALNLVNFTLTGPAEWRGGIAQGPDNYVLSKSLPVECGVNRALIRAATQAGKITLQASAEGLRPAALELVSRPVSVSGGLSLEMPADGLPVNLQRGPTPPGASYTTTRQPVAIARVTAGANNANAALTYDDNEMTEWANDGQLSTAWIEYQFAQTARANAVTLKLTGWRNRAYPLRLTIDGQLVWQGLTPRSLGYITLNFPATRGRSLKIELTAPFREGDAFSRITELGSSSDVKTMDSKGTLSIVETEIYR